MKTAKEILEKYEMKDENDDGTDCLWWDDALKAMEEYAQQQPISRCTCTPDETTGTTQVHCCNICGKPTEEFWYKKLEFEP